MESLISLFSGIRASFAIPRALVVVVQEPVIQSLYIKTLFLNFVLLVGSVLFYDHGLFPVLHGVFETVTSLLHAPMPPDWLIWFVDAVTGLSYRVIWLGPLFLTSFVVNGSFYNEIAYRSYLVQLGAPERKRASYRGIVSHAANELYRLLLVFVFYVFSVIVMVLPGGFLLSFMCLAWRYAFDAFDFVWSCQGKTLAERIAVFETNAVFMLGFGGVFGGITLLHGSLLAQFGIYWTIYPLFIIMANHAAPSLAQTSETVLGRWRVLWVPDQISQWIVRRDRRK